MKNYADEYCSFSFSLFNMKFSGEVNIPKEICHMTVSDLELCPPTIPRDWNVIWNKRLTLYRKLITLVES